MFEKKGIIFGILLFFCLGIICAAAVENSLHLTIQTTNATGVTTGTFAFVFNISSSSDCANVVYSDSATLTTDNRGIISYYLENVVLDFSTQYWLCYYRNGTLINATKLAKTPYSFTASNISTTGGLNIAGNLNITGNLYINGSSYSSNYINPIVASGNNSNGYYVKYIDGTLVQWGGWYQALSVGTFAYNHNFPVNFTDTPQSFFSVNPASSWDFTSNGVQGGYGVMSVIILANSAQNVYIHWYAIGKWTNTPYDNSTITVGGGIPSGAIVAYNRTSCPVGWIAADGSSGTPDLRGIFIRGSGTNSILKYANGTYFSATQGSYKNDSFQGFVLSDSITGQLQRYSTGQPLDNDVAGSVTVLLTGGISGAVLPNGNDGTNGVPRIGAETTPAYYSTIYCVKTTEDSATSNSIWATSGNNVILNNASMNVNISGNLSFGTNGGIERYETGWISRSDWTNVHLGSSTTKNLDSDVTHNLNAPLSELLVKVLISTDGTDANSFEVKGSSIDSGVYDEGYTVYQVSNNAIKVQTAGAGIFATSDSGSTPAINTQDWYYKIKVWNLG